jgi:hypothetical protein
MIINTVSTLPDTHTELVLEITQAVFSPGDQNGREIFRPFFLLKSRAGAEYEANLSEY